jgi:hypothetical protein
VIELFNIFFVQFRRRDLLRSDTEPQVQQKSITEETPQHNPQSVLSLSQVTDQPAGNKDTLNQADEHGKVIGNCVLEKWDLHNTSALSVIKLK